MNIGRDYADKSKDCRISGDNFITFSTWTLEDFTWNGKRQTNQISYLHNGMPVAQPYVGMDHGVPLIGIFKISM